MTRKPYKRYYQQSSLKKVETISEPTDAYLSLFSDFKTMQELFDIYNVTNIADLKAAVSQENETKNEEIEKIKTEAKINKIAEQAAANIVRSKNKR
ncbi:MAG: hypothetical protein WCO98_07130 [bacterium]